MNKVLMVVFQFPPFAGSSAVQRTLRFVQHLPANGWSPIVLTVNPMAYEQRSDDLLKEIPPGVPVHRAFGLDTRQHLAIAGRYPAFLARPDRWVSWMLGAVPKALNVVRQERPQALWSTYPIASAHLVAGWVHRLTGLPWVADFRDPMAQEGYPADPATWRAFHRIESNAVAQAAYTVFTTPGAAREYSRRYPASAHKIGVIENGYDEHSFTGLPAQGEPLNPGMVTLLHSGVVYPSERDPTQLLEALGDLQRTVPELARRLRLRFRASSHDDLLRDLARRNGVEPLIECLPALPYREALAEMMRAEALLVLQASNCNDQIPAKIYEYLRCGRPVVGLTDPKGDTAQVLTSAGSKYAAPLDQVAPIRELLTALVREADAGTLQIPPRAGVAEWSREAQARRLAERLDAVQVQATR